MTASGSADTKAVGFEAPVAAGARAIDRPQRRQRRPRRQHRAGAFGRGRAGGCCDRHCDDRRQRRRALYPGVSWPSSPPSACSRCLRSPAASCGSRRRTSHPIVKAVVDNAVDGIVVTGSDGQVVYANAAYLDLTDASDSNDMRPVERAFIGDADASEAIYRLLESSARRQAPAGRSPRRRHQGPAGALAAVSHPAARQRPPRRQADGLVACPT